MGSVKIQPHSQQRGPTVYHSSPEQKGRKATALQMQNSRYLKDGRDLWGDFSLSKVLTYREQGRMEGLQVALNLLPVPSGAGNTAGREKRPWALVKLWVCGIESLKGVTLG
jgi:hypothetical protein